MERFWKKVDKTDTCWNWTAYTHKGRGMFRMHKRMLYAPRVSWFLAHGVWPSAYILHTCDNPSCVNPDHLFEGTQADNMRDMVAKARQAMHRGEKNGRCKTDLETVNKIKSLLQEGLRPCTIRDLGFNYSLVRKIKSGQNWKHTEDLPHV